MGADPTRLRARRRDDPESAALVRVSPRTSRTTSVDDNPADYSKPKGYETVRYPLVGPGRAATDQGHHRRAQRPVPRLRHERRAAQRRTSDLADRDGHRRWQADRGRPSRTSSSSAWTRRTTRSSRTRRRPRSGTTISTPRRTSAVVPLESPHNSIHLAVGGFDVRKMFDVSPIDGANGDMGENDTAGSRSDLLLPPLLRRPGVLALAEEARLHRPPGDHPGVSGHQLGGPPGTRRPASPQLLADIWIRRSTRSRRRGRQGKAVHVARLHQHRDAARLHLQPGSLEEEAHCQRRRWLAAADSTRMVRRHRNQPCTIRGSFLVSVFGNVGGERFTWERRRC